LDTQLILQLDGVWQNIDLYEDIPISVQIQETDITDFNSRKSPFTKQFIVPGTNNNAKIFEHYYEVNGIEFNPLVKINAIVQYRGTDIFNGLLRLNAVITNPTNTEFELYIMGEVGDWMAEIKDITLNDIQWVDLQHELSYENLTLSWEAKNNDVDGLFGGKILYPMINYGLPYSPNRVGTGQTPSFTYAFTGDTAMSISGNSIPPSLFKPSIRLHEVVKRIFELTSYTLISEFFETDYFKSIYMDTFLNGQLGTPSASGLTNQNIFRVYQKPITILKPNATNFTDLPLNSFRDDGYDPLNNIRLETPSSFGYFRAPFAGLYSFNVRFNFSGQGNVPGDFVVGQWHAKKGTVESDVINQPSFSACPPLFSNAAPNGAPINWFFTGTLAAGDYVKLFFKTNQSSNSGVAQITFTGFDNGVVRTQAPQWDLYSSPVILGDVLVDMNLGIPDLPAQDVIKALVTMFNLVIVQEDSSRTITIEPYNWYYNDADRIEKDFTDKLDLDSSYRVEPLSFELSKTLIWTYTKGSDEYLNKLFEDTRDYNFGRYKYVSTSNLLTSQQDYEIPFAAVPTDVLTGSTEVIIPINYKLDPTTEFQQPYATKPHLYFWAGNRHCYLDNGHQIPGFWWLTDGSTPIQQSTYPCVSHLSSLDIDLDYLVSDLNFGRDYDFFGNTNNSPLAVGTPFNLYNSFWKDYIDNNYSNETRRFSGNFYMTPLDLYTTKLTDKIYIKDSFYRIEKINEGNLIDDKITNISLIKERGGYDQISPPAPYYFLSGNTPYPASLSGTPVTSYTGDTQGIVCIGAAPSGTIYIYGGASLVNGITVRYFAFTINIPFLGPTNIYLPFPRGTYLRIVGDPDTFVVFNDVGQVLQITC